MKLIKCVFVILLLSTGSLFSQNQQNILPLEWDKYPVLDLLFLESGLPSLLNTRPCSLSEINYALSRLDYNSLSPAGKKAYQYIQNDLENCSLCKDDEGFGAVVGLAANAEVYYHTQPETDWAHGYEERLPMFSLPLEACVDDFLYGNLTVDFKEEHGMEENQENYTNIISTPEELDGYTPFRAFFALGGEHWSLRFGRDTLSWGNGYTGNMILSDFADFHDSLYFTTFFKYFKFTAAYLSLDAWYSTEEMSYYNRTIHEPYKAFFGHRMEFLFFEKLNIALTESVIFGNYYPELRDFNPLMVFHNWNVPQRSNSMFSAEIDYNPYKWFSLYGQLAVDEFQTQVEIDAGSPGNPEAIGYLAGIKGIIPLLQGYLNLGLEFAQTDPWLYNREHPLLTYVNRRRFHSYYQGVEIPIDKPLGYYMGPDSQVFSLRAGYNVAGSYDLSLEYRLTISGENTIYTLYSTGTTAAALSTPTGDPVESCFLHLSGNLYPLEILSLGMNVYWVWGGEEPDLQLALSLGYKGRFSLNKTL